MAQLFTNQAVSTLAANLANGGTTIVLASGGGNKFPSPTGGDYFLLTVYEKEVDGTEKNHEIVKCTARTTDTLTVERNAESVDGVPGGGNSYDLAGGANTVYAELRLTSAGISEMVQKNENLSDLPNAATARTNLALGDSSTKNVGTSAGTVAAGDHNHSGVYQPYDADLDGWAAIAPSAKQDALVSGTNIKTVNGASILGSGDAVITGAPAVSVVTGTTQTAAANTHYVLTNVAATTVTLPSSPTTGDLVWVTVANGLATNIIARNGNEINGVAEDMTIDNAYITVQLRWVDSTRDWRIV